MASDKKPPVRPSLKKLPGAGKKSLEPVMKEAPRKRSITEKARSAKGPIKPPPTLPEGVTERDLEYDQDKNRRPLSVLKRKSCNAKQDEIDPDDPNQAKNPLAILDSNPLVKFILESQVVLRGRRPKIVQLDRQSWGRMITLIHAGCTRHQAAKCIGIHPETFNLWESKAREHISENRNSAYVQFYGVISKAEAVARAIKEIEVAQTNPEFWLTRGPGRTTDQMPGWADPSKLELNLSSRHEEIITHNQNATLRIDLNTEDGKGLVSEALSHLHELGLLETTEHGLKLFNQGATNGQPAIPVTAKPSTNGASKNGTH